MPTSFEARHWPEDCWVMNWLGLGGVGLVWAQTGLATRAVATRHAERCCFSIGFSYARVHLCPGLAHASRCVGSTTWHAGRFTVSVTADPHSERGEGRRILPCS